MELWDSTKGEFRPALQGHSQLVSATAFSPDGRTLASGSSDGTIRLWSTSLGFELATFRFDARGAEGGKRNDRIESLTFSPDGRVLAATSSSSVLRLFRAAPLTETDTVTNDNGR